MGPNALNVRVKGCIIIFSLGQSLNRTEKVFFTHAAPASTMLLKRSGHVSPWRCVAYSFPEFMEQIDFVPKFFAMLYVQIMHKQGVEMLKLFRNYSSKTSLLDDFMYYENRQKIMHEERIRHFRRANGHVHSIEAPVRLNTAIDHSQKMDEAGTWVEKVAQSSNSSGLKTLVKSSEVSSGGGVHLSDVAAMVQDSSDLQIGNGSSLKIGSLSIHPKPSERQLTAPAASSPTAVTPEAANAPANVVTVGSLPIKVDGAKRSSEMLTIGTIALDPKALQHGKVGGFVKGAMRK